MDNRDIFDFKFVNRFKEREQIKNFLNNIMNTNILWIFGANGIGKSTLINKSLLDAVFENTIYINLESQNENNNCMKQLLEELQVKAKMPFKDFLKKNYIEITRKITKDVFKLKGIEIEGFLDLIFDNTNLFINNKNESKGSTAVLCSYIDFISKDKKIAIVLDNFSYCDIKSMNIIIDLINVYLESNNIYFILSTTNESLALREDIEKALFEKLPLYRLEIKKFDNENHFLNILSDIFDITLLNKNDIANIYNICDGNPDILKNFLRNLAKADGIKLNFQSNKATFDLAILRRHILNKAISIDISNLSLSENFLLRIIVSLGQIVDIFLLQNLSKYLYENILKFEGFIELDIKNDLNKLEKYGIINFMVENFKTKVRIINDMTYYSIKEQLINDSSQKQLSFYIYEYLQQHLQEISNFFIEDDLKYLIALHSFKSESENWESVNYEYGKYKYFRNHFIESTYIFDRLLDSDTEFSSKKMLLMATCYYQCGNYEKAEEILSEINDSQLDLNYAYDFYYLLGKIKNMLMHKTEAVKVFQKAIEYSQNDREKLVMALNMKHLALLEIEGERMQAENIFNSISLNLSDTDFNSPAIGNLLRNCANFYHGDKALNFLNIAEQIAIQHNNIVDIAFVKNSKGFEHFRQNNLAHARENFKLATLNLNEIKMHETAYSLNNEAICLMINKEYENANELFNRALFVNRSKYASVAIKTNLMMCELLNNNLKKSKFLAEELSEIIKKDNYKDSTILRKVYINLSFLYKEINELSLAKEYIIKAIDFSENTSSAYRVNKLLKELNINKNIDFKEGIIYFKDLDFEPWLLTFSHD